MAIKEYLAIGKLLSILAAVALICWQSSQIHRWHKHYDSEHAAHLADNASYRAAQKAAAEQNKAQVAKIIQQHDRINDEQVSTLDRRLELIRGELRKQQGSTAQRPASGAPASPVVEAPCRVTDPAWMCLSPEERLRAAENEERHDELIDAALKHAAVDPN